MTKLLDPAQRSACIGAWARYMLPRWPRLQIDVDYEPGIDRPDASRTMARLGLRTGAMVTITAVVPWLGPDPRGIAQPSRMVWQMVNGRQVLARSTEREPMRLQTVLSARDVARAMVLDRHAQIATVRAARELDRGYAVTTNMVEWEGPRLEIFGDRKQLPPSTLPDNVISWVRSGRGTITRLAKVEEIAGGWSTSLTLTVS